MKKTDNLMSNKELIEHGKKKALEIARKEGLKIGQVVGHHGDKIAYELKEIKGDTAVVWIPGKKESLKEFPLNELFDVNVASDEAVSKKVNQALSKFGINN